MRYNERRVSLTVRSFHWFLRFEHHKAEDVEYKMNFPVRLSDMMMNDDAEKTEKK